MYEYSSTRTTLTRDLEWALTQANCFCGDSFYSHYVYYDSANNRYARAAQCMDIVTVLFHGVTNTTLEICGWSNYTLEIPGFVLSQTHEQFIRSRMRVHQLGSSSTGQFINQGHINWILHQPKTCFYLDLLGSAINRPYAYNGLHKNPQGNWVWYNYDLSEFPISYSDWAPNYPDNSTENNCTAFNTDINGKLLWKNFPMNAVSNLNMALCQSPACTTESTECCWSCNGMPPEEYYKKKSDRYMRKLNRRKSRLINF